MTKPGLSLMASIAVALPIFHILTASVWLAAYCYGFGANIAAFLSPSDLFTASIRDLVPVYLVALLLPVLLAVQRHSQTHPYAADAVAAQPEGEARTRAARNLRRVRIGLASMIILYTIGVAIFSARALTQGKPVNFMLIWPPFATMVILIANAVRSRWNLPSVAFEGIQVIGGLFVAALFMGLSLGHGDRYLRYENAWGRYAKCGPALVIRRFSNYHLVVLPGGTKALMDENCRVRYLIARPL